MSPSCPILLLAGWLCCCASVCVHEAASATTATATYAGHQLCTLYNPPQLSRLPFQSRFGP